MEQLFFTTELKGHANIYINHATNIDDIDNEYAIIKWKMVFNVTKNAFTFDVVIIDINLYYREIMWNDIDDDNVDDETYTEKSVLIKPEEWKLEINNKTEGTTVSIEDIDVDLIKKEVTINY